MVSCAMFKSSGVKKPLFTAVVSNQTVRWSNMFFAGWILLGVYSRWEGPISVVTRNLLFSVCPNVQVVACLLTCPGAARVPLLHQRLLCALQLMETNGALDLLVMPLQGVRKDAASRTQCVVNGQEADAPANNIRRYEVLTPPPLP